MTSRQHTSPAPSGLLDAAAVEAVLVEHYPRLVRLAYLVLPPAAGRHRRVLTAHGVVQRALPRGRAWRTAPSVPRPRQSDGGPEGPCSEGDEPGAVYACIRARVLRLVLAAERPRRLGPWELRPLPLRPGLFPRVFGLRLFPRTGGADELALEQALSGMSAAGRAAYALRGPEGMADTDIRRLLQAVGVPGPVRALAEADRVAVPPGSRDQPLLDSAGFDPCLLQARPTDLMRRRQHCRAVVAAATAVVVCGGLLGLPGDTGLPTAGTAGTAGRGTQNNAALRTALDPGALKRAAPSAWKTSARVDFTVWPARGDLTGDEALLQRALAGWVHPGEDVTVSAAHGTATGPPSGPPRLLYAGRIGASHVALLHQGDRVARYAEPADDSGGAALDLARTDLAGMAGSSALAVSREGGHVRYLTAPWVTDASAADLLDPSDRGRELALGADGVTEPLQTPGAGSGRCTHRTGLLLQAAGRAEPYLFTDLGELTPVRLTGGPPRTAPADATTPAARARLARSACGLRTLSGRGVKTVNLWRYARQPLPHAAGTASWVCLRAETWRGGGTRVRTALYAPSREPSAPGTQAAQAEDTPACGPRDARVLSSARWKAPTGRWYVLAAGSRQVTSLRAAGDIRGRARGRTLAVPAAEDARVRLTARTADGGRLSGLGQE